jgi:SAM-dependent methyltransferase
MSLTTGRRPLSRAADALERVGLSASAFRLYQRLRAVGLSRGPSSLPPPYLRVLTTGHPSAELYQRLGRAAAAEAVAVLARHGPPLTERDAVLDFGCGCGRVASHLIDALPAEIYGCDVNPRLLTWSRENLRGDFRLTAPEPPLPYADGVFAAVHALSVFTHLHEAQARAWLAELARVTQPGGLALLSLFDQDMAAAAPFKQALAEAGYLVRREGPEGSNLLCTYFSRDRFIALAAPNWRPVEMRPAAETVTGQALAVLRRV